MDLGKFEGVCVLTPYVSYILIYIYIYEYIYIYIYIYIAIEKKNNAFDFPRHVSD